MTHYAMMQVWRTETGYDCHVTRQTDDRESAPRRRSYRNISRSSVCRFLELSGGYWTAYAQRPERREHELAY